MKTINLTALIIICLISFSLMFGDTEIQKTGTQIQPQTKPAKAEGGWQIFEIEYPKTPPKRAYAGSVFDGELFHVFSGSDSYDRSPINDLWAYDTETDLWTEVDLPEYVVPRLNAHMFANHIDVLIYGGFNIVDEKVVPVCDGYTYFSIDDEKHWKKISTENAPSPRTDYSAISTDEDMIIFGGYSNSDGIKRDCYAYNWTDNKWRKIEVPEEIKGRLGHNAIWTGKFMLITGGITHFNVDMEKQENSYGSQSYDGMDLGSFTVEYLPSEFPVTTNQAVLYDPKKNKWDTFDLKSARVGHTCVWTGKNALVWGGYSADGKEDTWCHNVEKITIDSKMRYSSGYLYPPKGSMIPARVAHKAFWTGHEMLIGFGDLEAGCAHSEIYRSGGVYDPKYDYWTIPRNCPFTIFSNKSDNLSFQKGNTIYNFNTYSNSLTGRYLVDKDIFLPGLGTGKQPKDNGLQMIDTPQGIFAAENNEYMNWRINTYAYWKFNEKSGMFERIDENRKDIQYGQLQMLSRNDRLYNLTYKSEDVENIFSVKQGFMGIYNPANNSWISANTSGNIPVDRSMSAQVVGEENMFVFSGKFDSEQQFSEVFEYGWSDRLIGVTKQYDYKYLPWFDQQRIHARQSKSFPILRDGYIYNYKQNRWKRISMKDAPSPRVGALSCEIDGKFAVFGGMRKDYRETYGSGPIWDDDKTRKRLENLALFDGGIYDPKTNTWEYIKDPNIYIVPYRSRFSSSLILSPFGKNLILYGNRNDCDSIKKSDKDEKDSYFAYIYDIAKKKWTKIGKPDDEALEIIEVLNVNSTTMLKINYDSDDKYENNYKWFIYDAGTNNWLECSLNSVIEEAFANEDEYKSEMQSSVIIRKFKDKLYFYTYAKTNPDEDYETENPRSTLRIYSYNPADNTTKELSNIELNTTNISDGLQLEHGYKWNVKNVRRYNSVYTRDRIVLYGLKSKNGDKYFSSNAISKMYVLIYNFPKE